MPDPDLTIKASPTKEFFIYMLTRDVQIGRALIDLVDNSVDGAKRLRPDADKADLDGLHVSLTINSDLFRIEDNCGGIPVDTARNYAFRFGRPKDAPSTDHSVGQFGVGMKRTFFKLGRKIYVRSATATSRFTMRVNVADWLAEPEDVSGWHFRFESTEENIVVPPEEVGTYIEVTDLLPETKGIFAQNTFLKEFEASLSQGHSLVLGRNLAISINGIFLLHQPLALLSSDKIAPASIQKVYYEGDPQPVLVRILAGVSERDKEDGGWYIFCNGRMVVRADQYQLTGWGDSEGKRMPKYHPDFAFFRGYVFFDCQNAALLPWTTTKTGVDADSGIYRAVREEMIEAAKPVLGFLREMAKERGEVAQGDRQTSGLEMAVADSRPLILADIMNRPAFTGPTIAPPAGPRMQRIQYSKPLDEVEAVKRHLGVKSLTDVGIRTFEYYKAYELTNE